MTITKDKIVSLNYTLKNDQGQVLEESPADQPLVYLHGHENIIPGLEKELNGLNTGDEKNVTVQPEEAYGQYNPQLVFEIPKQQFGEQLPETGQMVQLQSPQGSIVATVAEMNGDNVKMDANHPLAGQTLVFDVKVTEVRDASAEELQHGHPHGPGGHEH